MKQPLSKVQLQNLATDVNNIRQAYDTIVCRALWDHITQKDTPPLNEKYLALIESYDITQSNMLDFEELVFALAQRANKDGTFSD